MKPSAFQKVPLNKELCFIESAGFSADEWQEATTNYRRPAVQKGGGGGGATRLHMFLSFLVVSDVNR
jgi:hypothetical protein